MFAHRAQARRAVAVAVAVVVVALCCAWPCQADLPALSPAPHAAAPTPDPLSPAQYEWMRAVANGTQPASGVPWPGMTADQAQVLGSKAAAFEAQQDACCLPSFMIVDSIYSTANTSGPADTAYEWDGVVCVCVWPCVAVCGRAWPCDRVCDHVCVWPCVTVCGHVTM